MKEQLNIKVDELTNEGLKREYKIAISSSIVQKRISDKIANLSQNVKIDGFRPGKVPAALVKKRYSSSVQYEVIDQLVEQGLSQLIHDHKFKLATQPQVSILNFKDNEDLEYKLSFELMPTVTIPDFASITLEKLVAEITDADIMERLDKVAENSKEFSKSDKSRAEIGDKLVIDFEGKLDGVAFANGSAQDFSVELGKGMLLKDFEDQLVGVKPEQKLQINVKFPDDYMAKDLAGKEAVFDIYVKEILVGKAPEINDEFAQKLGLPDLQEVKNKVKEMMVGEWENASKTKLRKELFDVLVKKSEFLAPEGLVEKEFKTLWQRVEELKNKDAGLAKKTDDELRELYTKMAKRRVILGILLEEVNLTNKISIDNSELRQAVYEQARLFKGQEHEVLEYYRKNPNAVDQLRGPIMEDKAVNFILGKVNLKETQVPFTKLLEQAEFTEIDFPE